MRALKREVTMNQELSVGNKHSLFSFAPLFLLPFLLLFSFGCQEESITAAGQSMGEEAGIKLVVVGDAGVGDTAVQKSLSDFSGQFVVLNLWATWCGPCILEMPALEGLHRVIKEKGGTVVAVSADSPAEAEAVKKFVAEKGLTFPVLLDPEKKIMAALGATGFPETFFLSREGKFVPFRDPSSGIRTARVKSDRPWDSERYVEQILEMMNDGAQ